MVFRCRLYTHPVCYTEENLNISFLHGAFNDNGKYLHLRLKERLRHAVISSLACLQSCSILYISWINHSTTKNRGPGKTVWDSSSSSLLYIFYRLELSNDSNKLFHRLKLQISPWRIPVNYNCVFCKRFTRKVLVLNIKIFSFHWNDDSLIKRG